MVKATVSLAAKIGKGLATPAAPSTTAEGKAKDFFREVCRILPWTVSNYKLDELITVRDLRRNVAEQFQKHAKVTNPQVVDILIYKGREELEMVALQHKQRHHLVNDYISVPAERKLDAARAAAISPFMDRFYRNMDAYGRG